MITEVSEIFVACAALLCLSAVAFEALRVRRSDAGDSAFITAPLFLPLYMGGILQWLLFGLSIGDFVLVATCACQLVILRSFVPGYWRHHRQ